MIDLQLLRDPGFAERLQNAAKSKHMDFDADQLAPRYRTPQGDTMFAYTLNNTAVAAPRILIPLLEHHQ